MRQRIIRKICELNEADLTLAHVRTATVVRLPFHLCTGSIFRIADPDGDRLHIWLRNKVSIPHDSEFREELSLPVTTEISISSPDPFFTDALIIDRHPELRPGEFDAIRTGKLRAIGTASLRNPGFRLLNEVVGAHQMVRLAPYVSGLGASWPRMLTEREVFARILVDVVLLVDPDRTIGEDIVLALFGNIDQLPYGLSVGGIGDVRDYSSEQLSELEHAIRKLRNHAFYELKTSAIAASLRGDSIVAVVLGCAAVEGAHGSFMRLALRDKVPGKSGKFNKFMDGLLRDHGFFSLVQLSVHALMDDEERPTDEELERCLRGVTMRNAIMHAGIKKTGEYKMRQFTWSEMNDAYGGIMAVYRAFEGAVEDREKSQQASSPDADH